MTTKAELDDDKLDSGLDLDADSAEKSLAAGIITGGVPKNFRQQADMEAFYRFVYENDLRAEALSILDTVREHKEASRASKRLKAN